MTANGIPTTIQETDTICQTRTNPSIYPLTGGEEREGLHLGMSTEATLERALGNTAAHVQVPRLELATQSHNLMDTHDAIHIAALTRGNTTTIPLTGTNHRPTQNQTLPQPAPDRDQPGPVHLISTPYVVHGRYAPALLTSRLVPAPVLDRPGVYPTIIARPNRHRDTPAQRDGTICMT